MGAFCGALLIEKLAYLRSFVPSCTEKDNHRERMALPCQNPEGNHGKLIRMTKLYSQERYSHEEVEEVIEEMKPSLFSADVTSSQHNQEESVSLPVGRSFDLSTQDDQLLSQQRVFRQQFGFSSGQIGECSEHKRGRW
jgi:hypothetical protein